MATGSTATRDLCVCCGKEVDKSISRRRVGGTSSKLVLPVFVELHEKVFPGKTFLPDFSENSRLLRSKVVEIMGIDAGKEMKMLCSKKVQSILRKRDFSNVQDLMYKQ